MLSGGRRQPRKNLRTAGMSIVVKSTGSQVLLNTEHMWLPMHFEMNRPEMAGSHTSIFVISPDRRVPRYLRYASLRVHIV